MIAAVQLFNNPALLFNIETFPVLSQIAWTYLLHEFYERQEISVIDEHGNSLLLSQMIARDDCPLNQDTIKT
ncbi:hypothetical protein C8024_06325 [Sphingopyxis sp. BSNA05]|nr:hypothetical protein [Sphingopyxis sp. BSNA05]